MPLAPYTSRYRPLMPFIPPGVLSPLGNDSSLAFNPDSSEWGSSSYPDDSQGPMGGSTAAPPMPPPSQKATAMPPPSVAPASVEDKPPATPPQADAAPNTPAPEVPQQDSDAGGSAGLKYPGAGTTAVAAPTQDPTAAKIAELQAKRELAAKPISEGGSRPELKSHWYQDLTAALLSMGKMAPYANQIVHPKFTRQMGAYDAQVKDLAEQQKELETAETTGAQSEYKQAMALRNREQGAALAEGPQLKREKIAADAQAAADKLAGQKDAAQSSQFTKLIGKNTPIYLQPTDAPPQGWQKIPISDPQMPGYVAYTPSPLATVPKELLPYLPGSKEGDQIDRPHLDEALKLYQTELNAKATKAASPPSNEYEGYVRQFTDPVTGVSDFTKANSEFAKAQEKRRATSTNTVTFPGLGQGSPGAQLTGDDFIHQLEQTAPGTAAQVRAIAEGRSILPPISTRGASNPLRDAVFRYDPSFSEQRAQIRKSFTTGTDGRNIGNLNTAPVHLDQLSEVAKALDNGSFVPGNAVWNAAKAMFGSAAPTNFESLKEAVAGELARALTGNATIPEIQNISKNIQAKNSPQELAQAIDENLKILAAKLNTYQERYSQQIPNDHVYSPILPSAQQVFQRHNVSGGGGAHLPTITDQAAYDALPKGAHYIHEGKELTKQ